jgi:hypothetical protein
MRRVLAQRKKRKDAIKSDDNVKGENNKKTKKKIYIINIKYKSDLGDSNEHTQQLLKTLRIYSNFYQKRSRRSRQTTGL